MFPIVFFDSRHQVLALAQAGCDFRATNGMGHSGLSQAAAYGNTATLRAMLHVGADVAQYTAGKRMGALFRACYNGHVSCARALIEHKADVNVALADGTGCCYVAAEKNHCDILQLLIQARAAFDNPDSNGVTPLWRAAERGCADAIRFLIDARANIDALSKDGQSALHASACNGHAQVIAELLAAGADAELKHKGMMPSFFFFRKPFKYHLLNTHNSLKEQRQSLLLPKRVTLRARSFSRPVMMPKCSRVLSQMV